MLVRIGIGTRWNWRWNLWIRKQIYLSWFCAFCLELFLWLLEAVLCGVEAIEFGWELQFTGLIKWFSDKKNCCRILFDKIIEVHEVLLWLCCWILFYSSGLVIVGTVTCFSAKFMLNLFLLMAFAGWFEEEGLKLKQCFNNLNISWLVVCCWSSISVGALQKLLVQAVCLGADFPKRC